MTLVVAAAILTEAALSFLGFGIQPPHAALGKLIADGQGEGSTLWWLVTFPGLVIVLIALCVNFVGDGLRDALDPTQREDSRLDGLTPQSSVASERPLRPRSSSTRRTASCMPSPASATTSSRARCSAIVGESGSGKSVSVMSVLGLIPLPPGPDRERRGALQGRATS